MATIEQIIDRTTGSCSGMALPTFEVLAEVDGQLREYRLREWAWRGTWQLQQLKPGATGTADADFVEVSEFPSKQAALAFLEVQ